MISDVLVRKRLPPDNPSSPPRICAIPFSIFTLKACSRITNNWVQIQMNTNTFALDLCRMMQNIWVTNEWGLSAFLTVIAVAELTLINPQRFNALCYANYVVFEWFHVFFVVFFWRGRQRVWQKATIARQATIIMKANTTNTKSAALKQNSIRLPSGAPKQRRKGRKQIGSYPEAISQPAALVIVYLIDSQKTTWEAGSTLSVIWVLL